MPQPIGTMDVVTRAELIGVNKNLAKGQRGRTITDANGKKRFEQASSAANTVGVGGKTWDLTRGGIATDDLKQIVQEGQKGGTAGKQLAQLERNLKAIEKRAAKNKRGLSPKKAAEQEKLRMRAKNIQDGIERSQKEIDRRVRSAAKPKKKANPA